MNIFRNNKDQRLYTISHLIKDIRHLNNNGFAGIYAEPFKWDGEQMVFYSKNHLECQTFVSENFTIVANC
jgi:hypothetical protein